VVALGAKREDEQDVRPLGQPEELLEKRDRGGVRPVKILDRDDERRRVGESGEQLADDFERPPLQRFRRQLGRARGGVGLEREVEQRAEVRVELVGALREELVEPPAQADPHAQLGVVCAGPDPLGAQEVAERPIGQRLTVGDAPPLEPADPVPVGVRP
jgi:hypothetical protein